MLGERVFKITMNASFVSLLYCIMLDHDCNFLDVRIGGKTEHPLFFHNHPYQVLPSNLDNFYILKLSYHCYELLHTMIFDRKRGDFPEYMLHHFLTFTLILFSYVVNYLPVGAAVMILHDVTDLTVSLYKITSDITPMAIEGSAYLLMVISWVYVRLWYFPSHVICRIFEEVKVWHSSTYNASLAFMLTGFLCVLLLLHCFWFYLMVKGLLKRVKNMNAISLEGNENRAD